MPKAPAYVTISCVFFILTGIVFGYSCFFYPNSHPIQCPIKQRTGKDCPSCGFSRAFSYYTHFKIEEGKKFNQRSWPVFLFFLLQFFIRGFVVVHYLLTKKALPSAYIKTDVIISISGFLFAFLPLVLNL